MSLSVFFGTMTPSHAQQDLKNRLARESSAYLRSAAHQPVNWFSWGDEAFRVAKSQNKPILLDIGAVWCHWCHVMDAESYENDSIASLINKHFVAVKVDRDERPDIDARYQAGVSAISGQGGWPLTAFLTPDGRVFYGGTYFPPEDRHGRPGFPRILQVLSETFHKDQDKVLQNADYVEDALRNYLAKSSDPVELSEGLVDSATSAIAHEYDARYGGFGSAPKFPHSSAVELLLSRYDRLGEQWMIDIVTNTLRRMARGGIYDQLGGGFHRYSTDEKWVVPHFEKMLYDNAPLLNNYVHSYQLTHEKFFLDISLDIVRFVNNVLSDQADGGFYASQDADVSPGDDGTYFTWKMSDAQNILSAEEFQVAQLHFNIYEAGEMHADTTQNVLFQDKDTDVVASILKMTQGDVERILESAKQKMLQARGKRKTPYVDTTIYSSWNGMMVSAYFEAYKALGDERLKNFALKTLKRILRENTIENEFVTHRASAHGKEGFLDDQVEIANALLDAYEVTTESAYVKQAQAIMDATVSRFWDEQDGGFFDVPKDQTGIGALRITHKPIQDSPTAGANAMAFQVLNRLHVITSEAKYREYAERGLKHFAGSVQKQGMFAATYFLALDHFLTPPPHVVVVSIDNDAVGAELYRTALSIFRPGKTVSHVHPSRSNDLPATIKAMAQSFTKPVAFVCSNYSCAPPAYDAETLVATLKSFGKPVPIGR